MHELSAEFRRKRDKISERLGKRTTYSRLGFVAIAVGYIPYFIFFGGFNVLVTYVSLPVLANIDSNLRLVVGLLPFFAGMLIAVLLFQKAAKYNVTSEDKIFLSVFSALDDLGNYLDDGSEPDRKKAEKMVEKVSIKIDDLDVGDLKICKSTVGLHLKDFKEWFFRKVVGATRTRETDDLEGAYTVLTHLGDYLLKSSPEIKDLDVLIGDMKESITLTLPERKTSPRYSFMGHLKNRQAHRHIVVIGVIFVVSLSTSIFGFYYSHVSQDTAYVVFATMFGTLVASYRYFCQLQLKHLQTLPCPF